MKKILISMAILFTLSAQASSVPDEAIVKKFNETFPVASEVKWFEGKDYYQVSFKDKGILCKIEYTLNGDISRTLRYYSEKELCPFITMKVKEKYNDRAIKGIVELQNDDGLVYEIIMYDDTHLYIVNCTSDGSMHVKNKYKKA